MLRVPGRSRRRQRQEFRASQSCRICTATTPTARNHSLVSILGRTIIKTIDGSLNQQHGTARQAAPGDAAWLAGWLQLVREGWITDELVKTPTWTACHRPRLQRPQRRPPPLLPLRQVSWRRSVCTQAAGTRTRLVNQVQGRWLAALLASPPVSVPHNLPRSDCHGAKLCQAKQKRKKKHRADRGTACKLLQHLT